MQDEHGFIWQAMLNTVDTDLPGKKVLDAGCNRGGFLRMLVDTSGIGEGFGYDPAAAAVEDACHLAGGRPLTFEVGSTVPPGWADFDVAFSHEVLYLIRDLAEHATALFEALRPGSPYFAVMGMHSGSALMRRWHEEHQAELNLPSMYDLDAVAATFEGVGFDVSVARLKLGFVPASAHRGDDEHRADLLEWLDYYSADKVLFRFARPMSS
ncbi:MAG TPA: class I SAM-dependent methyltransferase [Acidimicrobiales bacterium]|nr:class I SAM-dependent methyltransferase [Acidimicrobiales bacterium]